jgi:hypothetical protein
MLEEAGDKGDGLCIATLSSASLVVQTRRRAVFEKVFELLRKELPQVVGRQVVFEQG